MKDGDFKLFLTKNLEMTESITTNIRSTQKPEKTN